MENSSQRIFGFDLMRALAVSGVVYAHSGFLRPPSSSKLAFSSEAASFGVVMFFVLSGFLVGSIALRRFSDQTQPGNIFGFLRRRWLRTLPAYFAFVLLNVGLAGWSLFDWKFLFFLQTMDGKEPLQYFNESWTLAIEEWFYLLLPFGLLLLLRLKSLTPIVPLAGIVILCVVCRYILRAYFGYGWRDTYHITLLNLDPILIGVIAAYVHRRQPGLWNATKWPGLIIGLLLLIGPVPIDGGPLQTVLIAPEYAAAAALLLPAAQSWRLPPRIIGMPITWIALISYSLYLSHLPMALVTSRTGFVKLYDGWSVSNVIAWLVASLGLAALSYLLVERTGMKIAAKLDEGARLAPRSRSDVLASGGNIKRSPSISPMAKLTIE